MREDDNDYKQYKRNVKGANITQQLDDTKLTAAH